MPACRSKGCRATSARCVILPGYRSDAVAADVMRGEGTRLLGAVALGVCNGWVVLPGTYSKWVLLREGRVEELPTYVRLGRTAN
jgi:2-dehydro-3-deoxygalactonokinase